MGGVWPVYPYVFYKMPYPESFTQITFSLLDNKAIVDQYNICLGLFNNQIFIKSPYPCSSKNVKRWEMKGEWLYAIDYKKYLYGTDWVQSYAFGMAALEPCVERSKLAFKCKLLSYLLKSYIIFMYLRELLGHVCIHLYISRLTQILTPILIQSILKS